MKTPKARTLYRVKGQWPFPLDMLRYDNSEPATPEMAALVAKLSDENCPDDIDLRTVYEIELHLKFPVRGGLPHGGGRRWESFLWRVAKMPYREEERP